MRRRSGPRRASALAARSLQDDIVDCFKYGPYLSPSLASSGNSSISVGSNVSFANDLIRFRGSPEYALQARECVRSLAPTLQNCQFNIERVAPLQTPLSFVVAWNVSFTPESVQLVALLSKLPGMKAIVFNILDRETFRSSFSWEQLLKFVWLVLSQGIVKLPHAVIKGQTELKMEARGEEFILIDQRERLSLIESIKAKRLKNRVLLSHLLEYLSARRPSSISFDEWEELVFDKIDALSVPGTRQFDIDGISPEEQQGLLTVSSRILGAVTSVVLGVGFVLAFDLLNKYLAANS